MGLKERKVRCDLRLTPFRKGKSALGATAGPDGGPSSWLSRCRLHILFRCSKRSQCRPSWEHESKGSSTWPAGLAQGACTTPIAFVWGACLRMEEEEL